MQKRRNQGDHPGPLPMLKKVSPRGDPHSLFAREAWIGPRSQPCVAAAHKRCPPGSARHEPYRTSRPALGGSDLGQRLVPVAASQRRCSAAVSSFLKGVLREPSGLLGCSFQLPRWWRDAPKKVPDGALGALSSALLLKGHQKESTRSGFLSPHVRGKSAAGSTSHALKTARRRK
ncbi:hypothetical protein NDU88_001961 [Pleurodeles waltl]|uniref:Uncharacterized protein n=1 Tax=Pleurodeles waltl TaxID=8319 RepID=A0AAV7KQS9_PLEWA|nr:hypothetical protein NDU88_001961 [Pleurodeles waltl]